MEILLNLSKKKWISTIVTDEPTSAEDTLTLCTIYSELIHHSLVHSIANWGTNVNNSHSYLSNLSIVTICFNYFGASYFPRLMQNYSYFGILQFPCPGIVDMFNGLRLTAIPNHQNITKLMKYSRYVNFLSKIRQPFLKLFMKYSSDFEGISGEALFVGTIIHSLDHYLLEYVISDPLWLTHTNPKYKMIDQFSRIITAGFNSDLPFLGYFFNRKYKNGNHIFFREFHSIAVKYDKELADNMDTCICK